MVFVAAAAAAVVVAAVIVVVIVVCAGEKKRRKKKGAMENQIWCAFYGMVPNVIKGSLQSDASASTWTARNNMHPSRQS